MACAIFINTLVFKTINVNTKRKKSRFCDRKKNTFSQKYLNLLKMKDKKTSILDKFCCKELIPRDTNWRAES